MLMVRLNILHIGTGFESSDVAVLHLQLLLLCSRRRVRALFLSAFWYNRVRCPFVVFIVCMDVSQVIRNKMSDDERESD